ncbi:MAG: hypothetical protein NTY09_04550 [bacterium]|nr:hypothetical protein [bacterium]
MPDQNNIIDRIDALITAVYRNRTLRPWDAGPDRAFNFEMQCREELSNWPVRNLTDFVHGSSTILIFLLHPGHYFGVATKDGIEILIKRLGGECFQALVEISHLGPYARVRFTRETFDPITGKFTYEDQSDPYRAMDRDFIKALHRFMGTKGIEILNDEILAIPVHDVDLDVTKTGYVKIYHCLFDEE